MKAPLCRAPDRPFGASVPPAPFNYGFLGPMNRWRPPCTVLQRGAPPCRPTLPLPVGLALPPYNPLPASVDTLTAAEPSLGFPLSLVHRRAP